METYELKIIFDAESLRHAAKIRDTLETVLDLLPSACVTTELGRVD